IDRPIDNILEVVAQGTRGRGRLHAEAKVHLALQALGDGIGILAVRLGLLAATETTISCRSGLLGQRCSGRWRRGAWRSPRSAASKAAAGAAKCHCVPWLVHCAAVGDWPQAREEFRLNRDR